jgi:pimeloyl-ACP methyl ester carboxylesterase
MGGPRERRGDGRRGAAARARAILFALPVAAAALSAGCASGYGALPPESSIPYRAALLRERDAVPARVHRVDAGAPEDPPLGLAVEDRGTGRRDRILVFVHGVLSDRRAWRYLVGDLGQDHDLLLVDLPGCGESDGPDPGGPLAASYAPESLAGAVLRALRAVLEGRAGDPRITLVGHSLGTAVILRALGSRAHAREFPDVLARVDGAVLLSPLDFAVEKRDPVFEQVAGLSGLEVALGDLFGLLAAEVVRINAEGVADPSDMPREEVDRMMEIFRDGPRRRAAQAMILSAVPFNAAGRPDWDRIDALEEDYARIPVPVLLVAGDRDETLPQAMAFKLRQQIPRAWLRILPRTMHSPHVERPRECCRVLREFVEEKGKGWTACADLPLERLVPVAGTGLAFRRPDGRGTGRRSVGTRARRPFPGTAPFSPGPPAPGYDASRGTVSP